MFSLSATSSVASTLEPLPSPTSSAKAFPFRWKSRSSSYAQPNTSGLISKTSSAFSLAPPPSYKSRPSSIISRAPSYDDDTPVVNALALDGGGVRGVATAVVIDTIMDDYCAATGTSTLPADLFDIMGGTSTGGLIAIVLGRLRATSSALVDIYKTLSKRLFSSKVAGIRSFFTGHRYSAKDAQRLFSEIVKEHSSDHDPCALLGEDGPTRVFVTAVNGSDASGDPLVIRSYPTEFIPEPTEISIADAARATTAAPSYFPSKRLPDGTIALDGGLIANNPTEVVITEARSQFGQGVRFGLLLSIGTGEKRPTEVRIRSAASFISLTKALGCIVTDSEKVHQRVYSRFDETGLGTYMRINIPEIGDIALDEYRAVPKIIEMTQAFMETQEMRESRRQIVSLLIENRRRIP